MIGIGYRLNLRLDIMGLKIDYLGGNCPVQSEGRFDSYEYYFRARGEHWSLELTDPTTLNNVMTLRVRYERPGKYAAGWMTSQEAFLIIVSQYFKWKRDQ